MKASKNQGYLFQVLQLERQRALPKHSRPSLYNTGQELEVT